MKTHCLAGLAVLALLSSPVLAQSISTESTTSTTVPGVGSSATKTQKSIDATGTEVESKQSTQQGLSGSSTQSQTKVKRADGSIELRSEEKRTSVPSVLPNSSTTTTTTIQR